MKRPQFNTKTVGLYCGLALLFIAVVGASWWLKPAQKPQSEMGLPLFRYRFVSGSPGDPPIQQLVIAAGTMRTRLRLLAQHRRGAIIKLLNARSHQRNLLAQLHSSLRSKPPIRLFADGLAFLWLPWSVSATRFGGGTGALMSPHQSSKPDASYVYSEGHGKDLAIVISSNAGNIHSVVFLSGRAYLRRVDNRVKNGTDMQIYHRYRFLTNEPSQKRFPMTREASVLLGPTSPLEFPGPRQRQAGGAQGRSLPLLAEPPR